jgi:hypothetical protein
MDSPEYQTEIDYLSKVANFLTSLAVIAAIAGVVAGVLVVTELSDLDVEASELWFSVLSAVSIWFVAVVASVVGSGVVTGIQGLLLGESLITR